MRQLADRASREGTPLTGVEPGPRAHHWRPDQPATIVWAEALDGGDPKNVVPFRDRVVSLAAPFNGQPGEIAKTEWRYGGIYYTDTGVGLLSENDRASRRTRTWILEPGAAPRKVWDRKQDAAYDDPGTPVTRRDAGARRRRTRRRGGASIIQNGDFIYLAGVGASPEGDRPFLDRAEREDAADRADLPFVVESLESFVAPLNDEMTRFMTRYETQKEAPNYYARDAGADAKRAVTAVQGSAAAVARHPERQYVTYKRNDGVTLSGTLYLPPGYKQGDEGAGDHVGLPARVRRRRLGEPGHGIAELTSRSIRGGSHLFLLLSGYAIFDNPTMPIIGPGETANDTYVEQLVASAQAAIDKVVEMGVADRDHIGVGGHSYGGS